MASLLGLLVVCILVGRLQRSISVELQRKSVYKYYKILEKIGVGAFGKVYKCREKKSGELYAAKFIQTSENIVRNWTREEIDIMNQLNHNNLLKLHDAFQDTKKIVLIVELLEGGELLQRRTVPPTISEREVINYIKQICEGTKHMHERNIAHLDLTLANIMCLSNSSEEVKIIDFGSAAKLIPNGLKKVKLFTTGDPKYAAPEIVERRRVDLYTDMWTIGVIAYVLSSGKYPFTGKNNIETLKNIENCHFKFDEVLPNDISEEGKEFIRRLLMRDGRVLQPVESQKPKAVFSRTFRFPDIWLQLYQSRMLSSVISAKS